MPLSLPSEVPSTGDISAAVWAYVTRILTSLANPNDIVKFLGKGTGTEVPSDKSLYDLIALDRLDNATYGLSALRTRILERALEDGGRLQNVEGAVGAIEGATTLHNKLTAARAAFLDAAISGRLSTSHFDASELETEWNTDPVVQNVASAAETALTAGSITPTYPTGSVERRAILLPMIKAASQAANTHHIGIKVQYRTGGAGPYSDLVNFTANPPLTLVPADGAVDSWAHPIDVTAMVSTGVQVEFRFAVDSDNAGSINYTTSFVLVLVYRMG